MQAEEEAPSAEYDPTSPASSIAGDPEAVIDASYAQEFGYDDDGAVDTEMDPTREPQPAQAVESSIDFTCKPCDERVPMTLPCPMKPSKEDVERHYTTHLPYRNWCPVCVKAKGREDAHARGGSGDKTGLPVISMDYSELDDEAEARSNKTLVAKDEESGALLQYKVKCKGTGDDWVIKKFIRDIEELGRTDIRLKTDGEPAIVALQAKVQEGRRPRTVPCNPPAYNPQSNGCCEKGVQDATGQTRVLKLGLEARLNVELSDQDKIMEWIYVHAPFLVTRYSVGHDGMTPWERLTGSKWHRPAVEIGETVLAKLATRRGGKMLSKQKKKLVARSIRAVWVGQVGRTGEHIVVGPSGDAVRCRTIFRVPEDERWDKDRVLAILGTPRVPAPSKKDPDRITARLVDDEERAARPRQERGPRRAAEASDRSGVGLHPPEVRGPRLFEQRKFRITDRVLEKYGYSDDCKGCSAKRNGLPSEMAGDRAHSATCRQRLAELMAADEEDKEIVERDARKFGDADKKKQPAQLQKPGTDAKDDDLFANEPNEMTIDHSANDDQDNIDGIPQLDEDTAMEKPDGRDDDGDNNDEPNTKRQRLKWLSHKTPLETMLGRTMAYQPNVEDKAAVDNGRRITSADSWVAGGSRACESRGHNAEGLCRPVEPCSRETESQGHNCPEGPYAQSRGFTQPSDRVLEHLNMLTTVRDRADVKQLIKELEQMPKMKLPTNHRERRTMRAIGKNHISEIYSPPRIAEAASALGLKGGWSLDLTTADDDGKLWNFSCKEMRDRARAKMRKDKPYLLVASPMCGPFSELQELFNYPGMQKEEVRKKLEDGLEHVKFCLELCLEQHQHGRAFLLEHPAGASTWATQMIAKMKEMPGIEMVTFDFCMLGMKVVAKDGEEKAARKRTTVLTNSPSIQLLLKEAKCRREHGHTHLLNGTAKACEIYPDKFCRLVCEGVKRDLDNLKWRDEQAAIFDITQPLGKLLKLQEQAEMLLQLEQVCPPEEDPFSQLYEGMDFVDDVTGEPLDKDEAVKARKLEMMFFKEKGVYTKVRRQPWMKIITTRWLDVNKGDSINWNYRARLVAREIKRDKREDLFAATPPLESLRMITSICAGNQHSRHPADNFIMMTNDVKRAYFHAAATRPIYIKIPKEDWEEGDEDKVGRLNLSLYGTRDAAQNWARTVTTTLTTLGFKVGEHSPCNFRHESRGIALTVHGDDFTSTGRESELRWLDQQLRKKLELKTEFLGPDTRRHVQQVRVLNRVLTWTQDGLVYEADQRHAEILIRELGLENGKPVATPGAREDIGKASAVAADEKGNVVTVDEDGENPLLKDGEATKFRALTARANYLAQDRPDAQYAIKEIARRMATPRVNDWCLLKRLGRYLLSTPRATFQYYWQHIPKFLDTYVDSDWAGCKGSSRSTSGGAAKMGFHTVKTWATTQAVIALSSGEAELYALTKGAANSLGLVSLAADFGLDLNIRIHTDASAAIGMVHRQGVGKLRHVRVQYLWVQAKVQDGEMKVQKIDGKANPADLVTKNLPVRDIQKHLEALCIDTACDRASLAPQLAPIRHGLNHDGRSGIQDPSMDSWITKGGETIRVHQRSRVELFTPLRAQGAPPARALTPARITTGQYCDDGERFTIVDTWTARANAHRQLERRWTGTTKFLMRVHELQ